MNAYGQEFSDGELSDVVMERLPLDAELWHFKALYYFYGPRFTKEQKTFVERAMHKSFPFEEVPTAEAGVNAG
jgi:hypothetical protein